MEVGGGPKEKEALTVTTGDRGEKRGRRSRCSFHPPGGVGKSRRALGLGHIMCDLAQISIWIKSSLCPLFSVSSLQQLISLLDHTHQQINML